MKTATTGLNRFGLKTAPIGLSRFEVVLVKTAQTDWSQFG